MERILSQKNIHTAAVFFFVALLTLTTLLPYTAFGQTTAQTGVQANANPQPATLSPLSTAGSYIGNMIMTIGALVTGFGGSLLTASIDQFIIGINGWIGSGTPLGTSIENIWLVIRDICNLAFIFGFIYIGIRTIIDADSSSTKRMLASIIIGALLINFSLFFARVIIDISNYMSVEIYNTLVDTRGGGSLATSFENAMGLSTLYNIQNIQAFAERSAGGNIAFYFMATLILMIAGFVFAAGAILLMVRFVALVLILCFSPILFAATVFPQTKAHANTLWQKLISYSFFAPVYLLLLVISLRIVTDLSGTMRGGQSMVSGLQGLGPNGTPMAGNVTGAFGIFLSFGVAIFFLIMSLQIASKFGIAASEKVIGLGNSMRMRGQRMLGNATFGLGAAAGRATIGRTANYISEKDGMKDAAARRGLKGWAARRVLKGSRVVADASFDARNVNGMGEAIGAGAGRKGGYATVKGEIKKQEEEFAKSLGEIDDSDVQVKARKVEHSAEEQKLRLMEEQLNRDRRDPSKTTEYLAKARTDIEEQKEKIEKAKAKFEQEKMRRVLGSSYSEPKTPAEGAALKTHDSRVKGKETEIKERWNGNGVTGPGGIPAYKDLADETLKKARRDEIEQLNKQLDDLKEARDNFVKNAIDDRGYAGVLEKDNIFTSWPAGRFARNNQYAGKKMREARQKGKPKDKDD